MGTPKARQRAVSHLWYVNRSLSRNTTTGYKMRSMIRTRTAATVKNAKNRTARMLKVGARGVYSAQAK